jgi:hypothetical protein
MFSIANFWNAWNIKPKRYARITCMRAPPDRPEDLPPGMFSSVAMQFSGRQFFKGKASWSSRPQARTAMIVAAGLTL